MTSVTVNEIKVLVSLSGKRLPDLEEEIFANKELTSEYLYALLLTEFEVDPRYNTEYMAYWYSIEIIGGRWPAAERIIQQNDHWWARYIRRLDTNAIR